MLLRHSYVYLLVFLLILGGLAFALSSTDWFKAAFRSGDAIMITVGERLDSDPSLKPLLGVISGPDPVMDFTEPNLTKQYQDVGVKSVRNNDYFDDRLDMEEMFNCGGPSYPSWEGCDPNDMSNYYFDASDKQFASYIAGGFEPFLRLGGEYGNPSRRHQFKGPQNETQEANWIAAAKVVTRRYIYWQGLGPRSQYVDIWTEFPGANFWDRSDQEFINFWLNAYVELKAAFPTLKWGGVGFASGASQEVMDGTGGVAQEFFKEAYQRGIAPDWIGWHIFVNQATKWDSTAKAFDDLLKGTGAYSAVPWAGTGFFDSVEVIVDAYGLTSNFVEDPLTPEEEDFLYNGPQGAAILTAAHINMQYRDIEKAFLYRGGDLSSASSKAGLFHADSVGSYKPLSHAFKLWSRMYSNYPQMLQVTLSTGGKLFVLAGQNSKGQQALLISNPTSMELKWTVPKTISASQYYQVDGISDGTQPVGFTTLPVSIPAYGVQLVEISYAKASIPTIPSTPATPTAPVSPTDPATPSTPVTPTAPTSGSSGGGGGDNGGTNTAVSTSTSGGGSGGGGGGSGSSRSSSAAADEADVSEDESAVSGVFPFTDVKDHWGYPYIENLYFQGVVNGKTSTTFAPNDSASRAEILKIALLSRGQDLDDEATEPFTDVRPQDWFYPYVATAYGKAFVKGYSTGLFEPNKIVNRAEAVQIFLNTFEGVSDSAARPYFSDVHASDWFAPPVLTLHEVDVLDGYSDGTFRPANAISRAEVCAIAVRMQEVFGKQ